MKLQKLPEWYLSKLKSDIEASYKITENGCWEWQKSRHSYGYGKISVKNAKSGVSLQTGAHRVYYQLIKGFIADNLVLHHKCENPPCINPDHLELTTQWDNNAKGIGITANNIRKTHCDNGHEFTDENTGRYSKTNWRYCRTCSRKRTNRRAAERTKEYHLKGLNTHGKSFNRQIDLKRSMTQRAD